MVKDMIKVRDIAKEYVRLKINDWVKVKALDLVNVK